MVRRDREQETHNAKIFSPMDTSSLRTGTQSTTDTKHPGSETHQEVNEVHWWCGGGGGKCAVYPVCRWYAWSAEYWGTWQPILQPWVPMFSYCYTGAPLQESPADNISKCIRCQNKEKWKIQTNREESFSDLCRELLQVQDLQCVPRFSFKGHQMLPSLHGHNADLKDNDYFRQ